MLNFSRAQMAALDVAALRHFEDRTWVHLQRYFPGHCALLGEAQMRAVVRHGWARASAHGLTPECCAVSYIDFMCLLGSDFDTDPLLTWAADILADRSLPDPVARGDRLYDRGWAHIRQLVPDYRDREGRPLTQRFVGELRQLGSESDEAIDRADLPAFCHALMARLHGVFPAKFACVGDDAVCALVIAAVGVARGHGIVGGRGITLVAVLMFVLGHGFHRDPLLPWAEACLNDTAGDDEKKKVDRLLFEGVGTLRRWWALDRPRA